VSIGLRNRYADRPSFLFVADESPLHRKLGIYEVRE
jgi:gentisate 1,2-dioxygenase